MTLLCHTNDINEDCAKGFDIEGNAIFAVKKEGVIFIYQNNCPHLGVNLEWMPDEFLDSEKELIQCSTHGALFVINTGECVSGPCLGEKLTPIEFYINQDQQIILGTQVQK